MIPSTPASPRKTLAQTLSQPTRTRLAPSPTGFFHLGTARCAIQNKLAATASGGEFLLRIDDTDAARNNPAHLDLIYQSLTTLGLDWDRTFTQSERNETHKAAAHLLLQRGLAIMDQGALMLAPDCADRLPGQFFDLASGECTISSTTRDQVRHVMLLKSDGNPTYQLASVVDDIDSKIDLILRGADHLPNTPKQMAISQALADAGWEGADDFCARVQYAHVGLVTQGGKKLSKRDSTSNLTLTLEQHSPEAVFHWALMLGWGHPDPAFDKKYPFLDLAQAAPLFAQGRLRSSNCDINLNRLSAFDRVYRKMGRVGL